MKTRELITSESGLSILLIIVIVALVGLTATIATRLVVLHLSMTRHSSTANEMSDVYEGIFGNPDKGTFGYVGDMGVPASSLNDLITNPGATAYTVKTNGVMMGFNGPYVNIGAETGDFKNDEWGSAYVYSTTPGNNLLTSIGKDRTAGTSDDIAFQSEDPVDITPIADSNFFKGNLVLRVLTSGNSPSVKVYYSNNGQQAFLTSGVDFTFEASIPCRGGKLFPTTSIPIHQGIHAVEVTTDGKTIFDSVSVYVGYTTTAAIAAATLTGGGPCDDEWFAIQE